MREHQNARIQIREAGRQENRELQDFEIAELIARAFLTNRFPLSENGRQLREDTEHIVLTDDPNRRTKLLNLSEALPTVESPKLELFSDLEINDREELGHIFGGRLNGIISASGCSRDCTGFCAADAHQLRREDLMPFAGVLKIAEAKKIADQMMADLLRDIHEQYDRCGKNISAGEKNKIAKEAIAAHNMSQFFWHLPLEFKDIVNYYANEVSDYRDHDFLHKNGSPADYSDFFQALATKERPIQITTSGWRETDVIADRAMKNLVKICLANPSLLSFIRISFNLYNRHARTDLSGYQRAMKHVVEVFKPLGAECVFVNDHDNLVDTVFLRKELGLRYEEMMLMSRFSGNMPAELKNPNDYDVMKCMAGNHIFPDGRVMFQEDKKGARPEFTGKQLYKLAA